MILKKIQRLIFHKSKITTNNVFETLHADFWSPYHSRSISGAKYVLTLVYDHLKATWTFLLHDKTQVFKTLHDFFFSLVQNQFQKQIKVIRTDNGSKFVNIYCTNFV